MAVDNLTLHPLAQAPTEFQTCELKTRRGRQVWAGGDLPAALLWLDDNGHSKVRVITSHRRITFTRRWPRVWTSPDRDGAGGFTVWRL